MPIRHTSRCSRLTRTEILTPDLVVQRLGDRGGHAGQGCFVVDVDSLGAQILQRVLLPGGEVKALLSEIIGFLDRGCLISVVL